MKATVNIPGDFIVEYENGEIKSMAFWPHASFAGYFGPSAVFIGGDENLDIESTDGPFWGAVQEYLQLADRFSIEWKE